MKLFQNRIFNAILLAAGATAARVFQGQVDPLVTVLVQGLCQWLIAEIAHRFNVDGTSQRTAYVPEQRKLDFHG